MPYWFASIITGLIDVLYSKVFLLAENLTSTVLNWHLWALFILSPICFIIAWWLVHCFARYSRSEIPQVMAAIELSDTRKNNPLIDKLLSIRIAFVKII